MSDVDRHPQDEPGLTRRERELVHEACCDLAAHATALCGVELGIDDVAVLPDGRLGLFERDGDRVFYFATDPRTDAEVFVEAGPTYVRSVDADTGETVAELVLPRD